MRLPRTAWRRPPTGFRPAGAVITAAALLAATAPAARSTECVDWSDTVHWIGGLSWGQYPLSRSGQGVEILGDLAYVACGEDDLQVVSLTDPAHPEVVTFRGFSGSIGSLELAGTTLALSRNHGTGGSLVLFDVVNPAVPALRGSLFFPDNYGVSVKGLIADRAVVGVYREGFRVVDVSDPDHPADLGQLEPSVHFSPFVEITTAPGPIVYACEKDFGLAIYDFSTPMPTRLPESYPGIWTRVAHEPGSSVAYLSGTTDEIDLIVASLDVSDPLHPVVLDAIAPECARDCVAASLSWRSADGIYVQGDRVVVTAGGGNVLIDASDPAHLVSRGAFLGLRTTRDLEFWNGHLVLGETYRGLNVYVADLFTTEGPAFRFDAAPPPPGGSVSLRSAIAIDDHVYLAGLASAPDGYGSLDWVRTEVVEFTAEDGPVTVNVIDHPGNEGFSALFATPVGVFGVRSSRIQALSLQDPVNPVVTGTTGPPGGGSLWITDLDAAGTRLFATATSSSSSQLIEVDVSDPSSPAFVSMVPLPGSASGVALRGDRAYVAAGTSGVRVLDVSVSPPVAVGSATPGGRAIDIEIEGDLAFVALGEDYAGLGEAAIAVLDLSSPDAPSIRAGIAVPQAALDVEVANGIVYVASDWAGVTVIDARDPWNVVLRGGAPTRVRPEGLAISSRGVLAWAWSSFDVVAPDCAATATVGAPIAGIPGRWALRISPNPTHGPVDISLTVPDGTFPTASVYDVRGRRIRDLTLDSGPGSARARWTGVDRRDRPVPAGVYFVRVEAGGRAALGKVVLRR